MFSNKYLIISILLGNLYSCNNAAISDTSPSISLSNDSVEISIPFDKEYNFSISILGECVKSGNISENSSYSLLDLSRMCTNKNDVALFAVKNNNHIPIRLKIGESIDTLINFFIEPYNDEDGVASISGLCAPLISKFSSPSQSIELKKWLFRKKIYLKEEQMHIFMGLINQLSYSKTKEFITNATIPVLHTFAGLKYNVESNMAGDYFVLFASKTSNDISKFVEEVVANDFELCATSVSKAMSCYRETDSNGYMCICLVAIKKDWTYKIYPLGIVAIDNVVLEQKEKNISSITLSDDMKVILPSNKPDIYGSCHITNVNGGGNGIECNVSFNIFHSGDIKTVTIKRTKELCYDSWVHKIESRVISVKDVPNPYSFTMMLHLKDGDNYIPVVVEDNHGNKTEFNLNEKASFIKDNTPSINIDNNVNIYD